MSNHIDFYFDIISPYAYIAHKKILKNTKRWSGLKNLDLAKQVTTKRSYIWQGFKTVSYTHLTLPTTPYV